MDASSYANKMMVPRKEEKIQKALKMAYNDFPTSLLDSKELENFY
jgi:hypothetical protein